MKYDARRNYLYPVLRPYSDDYPDAKMQTLLRPPVHIGEYVRIELDFIVDEQTVRWQVDAGEAVCVAMLYCRSTLYREMLRADKGSFRLNQSVEGRMLVGDVELHPSIIAVNNISHSTRTAHPEYGGTAAQIGKWQPLATDQTWRIQVNADHKNAESAFRISPVENLSDDEFDVLLNPANRYIDITVNTATYDRFQQKRKTSAIPMPTIYMSALVEALSYIKYKHEDGGEEHSNGWVNCLNANLKKHSITIGNADEDGSHSVLRAAQLLLEKPFATIYGYQLSEEYMEDTEY